MKAAPENSGLPALPPETGEVWIDPGETESDTCGPAPVNPEYLKWLDELL